jgi:hypothetical protein
VIHELIHAYDICRAKVDWNNCRHYACTEIRASSLRFVFASSGDLTIPCVTFLFVANNITKTT